MIPFKDSEVMKIMNKFGSRDLILLDKQNITIAKNHGKSLKLVEHKIDDLTKYFQNAKTDRSGLLFIFHKIGLSIYDDHKDY